MSFKNLFLLLRAMKTVINLKVFIIFKCYLLFICIYTCQYYMSEYCVQFKFVVHYFGLFMFCLILFDRFKSVNKKFHFTFKLFSKERKWANYIAYVTNKSAMLKIIIHFQNNCKSLNLFTMKLFWNVDRIDWNLLT